MGAISGLSIRRHDIQNAILTRSVVEEDVIYTIFPYIHLMTLDITSYSDYTSSDFSK